MIQRSVRRYRTLQGQRHHSGLSASRTSAQNGNAERHGRIITTLKRSLRIAANLPATLWPEMVKTAEYLMNRTSRSVTRLEDAIRSSN